MDILLIYVKIFMYDFSNAMCNGYLVKLIIAYSLVLKIMINGFKIQDRVLPPLLNIIINSVNRIVLNS